MTRPGLDHSPHNRPTAGVSVARCPQTYLLSMLRVVSLAAFGLTKGTQHRQARLWVRDSRAGAGPPEAGAGLALWDARPVLLVRFLPHVGVWRVLQTQGHREDVYMVCVAHGACVVCGIHKCVYIRVVAPSRVCVFRSEFVSATLRLEKLCAQFFTWSFFLSLV